MKWLLYWVGVPLIMAVTFAASLRWPEFVIWVAWMLAALLWFSASVVGGEAEEAKRSRDRWASLARKAEAEVDRLQRQLASRQTEVENLRGAIDKFAELVDTRNAEIGRLRPLLVAARPVVGDWERGLLDGLEADMPALAEAVAGWDGLAGVEVEEMSDGLRTDT